MKPNNPNYYKPKNPNRMRAGRRKTGRALTKKMRISLEVLQMLYLEKRRHETYNDVIRRIMIERNFQRRERREWENAATPTPIPPSPPSYDSLT
jgi:hypothetical protein